MRRIIAIGSQTDPVVVNDLCNYSNFAGRGPRFEEDHYSVRWVSQVDIKMKLSLRHTTPNLDKSFKS